MKYKNINEETLKNMVAQDFFEQFDCREIIKFIDFSVKQKADSLLPEKYFLWAEAKASATDLLTMLTQLILTIGKAKITEQLIPPPFLGCFDPNKIVFIEFSEIMDIFTLNDFNWNVAPSNTGTKEFKLIYEKLECMLNHPTSPLDSHPSTGGEQPPRLLCSHPSTGGELYVFDLERDETELRNFIKQNFVIGNTEINRIQINKNNFKWVYDKWTTAVKPTIELYDWEKAKANNIIDADFYLADLLSNENQTLKEKLFVVLKETKYIMDRHINEMGFIRSDEVSFKDNQKAHTQFWQKYERPPKSEYWDYIIERRDLLVPQDVRERKGSFFTPQVWVELSQKYIADVFGENWQDEYYVWDCAAGTGNLLAGLTNKYNIWASTLDKADVAVMHDRIKNGASLLEHHVFQFDFLNDNFEKLPEGLRKIIKNEPDKLIIYINPPYAEVSSTIGVGKAGVNISSIHKKYTSKLGAAGRELFAQFLIRIISEIKDCKIAEFSKLKAIQGSAFDVFRQSFKAKLKKIFLAPANTFDNVSGQFPISFKIWDTSKKETIKDIVADIFDEYGRYINQKTIYTHSKNQYISQWITALRNKNEHNIGFLAGTNGNSFQHNNIVYIINQKAQMPNPRGIWINRDNLIPLCIYFAVRKVIPATWLNDRDQFLYPNDDWKQDILFQTDCLTYTLFHGSNNIQSKYGVNHWIPFTESEVDAKTKFESRFMTDFMTGKIVATASLPLLYDDMDLDCHTDKSARYDGRKLQFSDRAIDVFKAGKELWKYYHSQKNHPCPSKGGEYNVNASFYEIREYFQGRDDAGKMKSTSQDERYNFLLGNLKLEMKFLAQQIEPRIYEHGFLVK